MAIEVASLYATLGLDDNEFNRGIDTAKGGLGGLAGTLKTGLLGVAAGVGAGVVTAVVGIGAASVSVASQVDQAAGQMQASLGVTADVANELADTALAVFGNNFAGSIEEASQGVIAVSQQLKGIPTDQIQDATENAYRLRDAFGVDLDGSLNAVNTLMSQFGLTQQEAFDLVTAGFQRGLDSSGDFLDSITEYGGLFAQGGATAGQFFSTLETGLQGGVLGTDKAADAFKEFQIRFLEGGDEISDAITKLAGDDYQMFIDEIKSGDTTVANVFDQMIGHLASIEDPIERNRVGVALMGTQFEDMGADAVMAIDTAATSLEELSGATDSLDAQYQNFGSMLEGLKRTALIALEPLGEKLLEIANQFMPLVEGGIKLIGDALSGIDTAGFVEQFETARQFIQPFINFVRNGFLIVQQLIGDVDTSPLTATFNAARESIAPFLDVLRGGFENASNAIANTQGVVENIKNALTSFAEPWKAAFGPAVENIQNFVTEFKAGVGPLIDNFIGQLQELGIIDRLKEAFDRIGEAFVRLNEPMAKIVGLFYEVKTDSLDADAALGGFGMVLDGLVGIINAFVVVAETIAFVMEGIATGVEAAAGFLEKFKVGLDSISVPSALEGIGSALGNIGSKIPGVSALIGQSPSPLAVGIRTASEEVRRAPKLSSVFGLDQFQAPDPASLMPDFGAVGQQAAANARGNSEQPLVVNVHIGEQMVEQIISRLQGRRAATVRGLGNPAQL